MSKGDIDGDGFVRFSDFLLLADNFGNTLDNAAGAALRSRLKQGKEKVVDLKQTYLGDANLNGEVDFADFLALANNFGQAGGWSDGDFDANGLVQFLDFLILADNFGKTSGVASVPEPSGKMIASMGLLCCILLRRRSRSPQR